MRAASPFDFLASLRAVLVNGQILTSSHRTFPYRVGFRCGQGGVVAVVKPRSLLEMWRVLQACTDANKIVIVQAANTGLTGGSTPWGQDYDREVVIINTLWLTKIHLIKNGLQVICLPGATLSQLEASLDPYGREPHSVIGSSCIGASVVGGICNNSGGALVRRGPAYTQMALFARVDETGRLQLINHLGVELGQAPEEILRRLERGEFSARDLEYETTRVGSDREYGARIRDVDADSPARFNADPARLFEASGCAGRVAVFAVRVDTFPKERETRVFYIGSQKPAELTQVRRDILSQFEHLPVLGEYLHRDLFDIAESYGKDVFLMIRHLGSGRMPEFFRWRRRLDSGLLRWGLGRLISTDSLLQRLANCFPSHLPPQLKAYRDRFEHHLILKMAGPGIAEAKRYLDSRFPSSSGNYFQCTREESDKALLHRFVAAGAAARYATLHQDKVEGILALDVALRRNDGDWFEELPEDLRAQMRLALYYGHFFCHVFHQDYVIRKGCDIEAIKQRLLTLLDKRGAEYPAEHNVGHLYRAKPALEHFYRSLDPHNCLNPGIGFTSRRAGWQ